MDAVSRPIRAQQNRELNKPQEEICAKKQRRTEGGFLFGERLIWEANEVVVAELFRHGNRRGINVRQGAKVPHGGERRRDTGK
jgi:hypothetical protein